MGCTCFRSGDVSTIKSNKIKNPNNESIINNRNENRNRSNINSNLNNNRNSENLNRNHQTIREQLQNQNQNQNENLNNNINNEVNRLVSDNQRINNVEQSNIRIEDLNMIHNIESPRRLNRLGENLQNTENRDNNRNDNRESIALNINRIRNNMRTNISNNVIVENEPYLESRNDPFFNFEEIEDFYVGKGIKKTKAFICPISREELDKKISDFWESRRDNSREIWEILRIICCKDIDNGKDFLK